MKENKVINHFLCDTMLKITKTISNSNCVCHQNKTKLFLGIFTFCVLLLVFIVFYGVTCYMLSHNKTFIFIKQTNLPNQYSVVGGCTDWLMNMKGSRNIDPGQILFHWTKSQTICLMICQMIQIYCPMIILYRINCPTVILDKLFNDGKVVQ